MNPSKLAPIGGDHPSEHRPALSGRKKNRLWERAENQEEVNMKKSVFLGALTVAGLAAGAAAAGTLDDVTKIGR